MDKHNLKSIAFPAISTGIFGYPIDKCAKIMISSTNQYLKSETQNLKVIFCLYTKDSYDIFKRVLDNFG